MSRRTRFYVALLLDLVASIGLALFANAHDWTRPELYAVGAGVLTVFVLIALPWMEMAPDGAWRRPPDRRPPA
jgi:hypothetical protein